MILNCLGQKGRRKLNIKAVIYFPCLADYLKRFKCTNAIWLAKVDFIYMEEELFLLNFHVLSDCTITFLLAILNFNYAF